MDRREFGKLLAVAVLVPSLAKLPAKQEFPVRLRYKGWDIVVDERPDLCCCKQVYVSKGEHFGVCKYDKDCPLSVIETAAKRFVNQARRKVA